MFYYFVEKYIVKILLKRLMMKYIILGTLAKNHNTKKDTLFQDCAPKRPNSILRHISLYSLNMRLPHKNKHTNKQNPGVLKAYYAFGAFASSTVYTF